MSERDSDSDCESDSAGVGAALRPLATALPATGTVANYLVPVAAVVAASAALASPAAAAGTGGGGGVAGVAGLGGVVLSGQCSGLAGALQDLLITALRIALTAGVVMIPLTEVVRSQFIFKPERKKQLKEHRNQAFISLVLVFFFGLGIETLKRVAPSNPIVKSACWEGIISVVPAVDPVTVAAALPL